MPPRYPVPREPRGGREQELHSLAARLGWRMLCARLWNRREGTQTCWAAGEALWKGDIAAGF